MTKATNGIVTAVYGNKASVRQSSSSVVLKRIRIVCDPTTIAVGDSVLLSMSDNRYVILSKGT